MDSMGQSKTLHLAILISILWGLGLGTLRMAHLGVATIYIYIYL